MRLGRVGGAAEGRQWEESAPLPGLGMGAVPGAYEGARYMLGGGNGGDAACSSSSNAPDEAASDGVAHGRGKRRRAHGAAAGTATVAGAVATSEAAQDAHLAAVEQQRQIGQIGATPDGEATAAGGLVQRAPPEGAARA